MCVWVCYFLNPFLFYTFNAHVFQFMLLSNILPDIYIHCGSKKNMRQYRIEVYDKYKKYSISVNLA